MKHTCDCIIPFFNEELRPSYVVEEICKVKLISKIIVVDDGSNDDKTYLELKAKFPSIKAIRLEKNRGKADAIREGLKHVTADYVFFIDADLTNIKPFEIENAIQKIIDQPKIDMIILPLVPIFIKNDWFRVYNILSGQRVLKFNDLQNIFKLSFSGFQIEAAINQYMILNKKKVFWMPSSIINLSKYQKWGFFEGITKVVSLFKEIIKYTGLRNFLRQTFFFCRNKAP